MLMKIFCKNFLFAAFCLTLFSCESPSEFDELIPVNCEKGDVNFKLETVNSETFRFVCFPGASLKFEIIQLQGSAIAARVFAEGMEFLDNSTFSYPDPLEKETIINSDGNWATGNAVLGTDVGHGGQFEGEGERYLGIRIAKEDEEGFFYGWVRIDCPTGNNPLEIFDFGMSDTVDAEIAAGQ